jgi:hypothetical protein
MYEKGEAVLFFFVFLSQVLLISWFYPRRVVSRMRDVLQKYPPSTHPKLYPLPMDYYERRLRNCARVNLAITIAGFLIIAALVFGTFFTEWDGAIVTPFSTSGEWGAAIVTPFFLVQIAGFAYLQLSGLKHYKAMAKAAPPRVRTTELRPRRLFDFVSPAMIVAVALVNVAFMAFILWYRRFEFPWFTAAGNISLVVVENLLMTVCIGLLLRARRADFHQAPKDRIDLIKVVIRLWLLIGVAGPLGITAVLLVKAYADPEFLEPVMSSLYVQIVALAMIWPSLRYRADKIDFDVYRRDAGDSTAAPTATQS